MSNQRKRLPWRCKNQQQAKDKAEIYKSKEWKESRIRYLRYHPLCEECEAKGIVRSAQCVHHRIPIESATTMKEMKRLAFDWNNLQSLCIPCHSRIHNDAGYHTKAAVKQRDAERHERRKARLIERFTGKQ